MTSSGHCIKPASGSKGEGHFSGIAGTFFAEVARVKVKCMYFEWFTCKQAVFDNVPCDPVGIGIVEPGDGYMR